MRESEEIGQKGESLKRGGRGGRRRGQIGDTVVLALVIVISVGSP